MSKIDKCIEAESVLVIARDQWVGIWGDWQWIWAFVFRLMKIFWSYFVMMVAQLWIYQKKKKKKTKTHWTEHYKWSDFMVCALHLNKAIFKKKKRTSTCLSSKSTYLPQSVSVYSVSFLLKWMNFIYSYLRWTPSTCMLNSTHLLYLAALPLIDNVLPIWFRQ